MISLSAKIYIDYNSVIEVNNKNMVSLERTISDRENIELPSWGIVSNKGEISFYDSDHTVMELISQRKLNNHSKIEIFINNTISKTQNKIGEYYSKEWKYDNDSRLVTVDMADDLEALQDAQISHIEPHIVNNFYDVLYESIYYSYALSDIVVDEETVTFLKTITNYFFVYEGNNAWGLLDDFAKSSMLHIYKNPLGKTVITHKI